MQNKPEARSAGGLSIRSPEEHRAAYRPAVRQARRLRTDAEQAGGRGLREGLDTQPGRAPGCYSTRGFDRRAGRERMQNKPEARSAGGSRYAARKSTGLLLDPRSTGAQVENGCRTSRRRGLREGLDTLPGRAPGCYSTRGSTGDAGRVAQRIETQGFRDSACESVFASAPSQFNNLSPQSRISINGNTRLLFPGAHDGCPVQRSAHLRSRRCDRRSPQWKGGGR